MKNTAKVIIFIVIAIALIGGGIVYNRRIDDETQKQAIADQKAAQEQAAQAAQKEMQMESQLREAKINKDVVVGTGAEAKSGDLVTVNYLGTLENGTKFDSSYDRKQPFQFKLGAGNVIKGWDLGVVGMKVGGMRDLVIPPNLGYGAQGAGGGAIPPNATLKFVVELLEVSSIIK